MTGAYIGSHGHLLQYVIGVKEALKTPLTNVYIVGLPLTKRFGPWNRIETNKHYFLHNGELREEYQLDDQYVGPSNLRTCFSHCQ